MISSSSIMLQYETEHYVFHNSPGTKAEKDIVEIASLQDLVLHIFALCLKQNPLLRFIISSVILLRKPD